MDSPVAALDLKRRLMDRVADADQSHVTIPPAGGRWQAFMPGVCIKVLREDGLTLTYLLRLDAGAAIPAHRHPADEECVVLEGSVRLGTHGVMGPGTYHLAHKGALHPAIRTDAGATLFLRGAIPEPGQLLA